MPAVSHPLAYAAETSVATITRFSYRTLFSRASLKNVCRIRFSKGIAGGVRSECEISGVWIDYHNPSPPAIVGQWQGEVGSFDLSQNEEVTEICTWVTRDQRETMSGPQLGKAVGISVSTSLNRSSGFIGIRKEKAMKLKFQGNRFEKLVCFPASLHSNEADSSLL